MPDDKVTDDKKCEPARSRTFELKKRLLKRAWAGESNLAADGAEMMLLIQWRLSKAASMPEDHEKMLNESALLNCDQPRSVQMLNALAIHRDSDVRFTENGAEQTLH